MYSDNDYEVWTGGMFWHSEPSLKKLIRWIRHNRMLLDGSCYQVVHSGRILCYVFSDPDAPLSFDAVR